VSVTLDNTLLTIDTDYAVDGEAGLITFVTPPPDGQVAIITYKFAPFTDAEAQALITEYGLQLAIIEALREILANTAKLRNYKNADTEVDNSQVFKQVKQLLDMYQTEYQTDQSAELPGVVVTKRNDPRGGSDDCRDRDISRLYV
jgi:hypothetical protein